MTKKKHDDVAEEEIATEEVAAEDPAPALAPVVEPKVTAEVESTESRAIAVGDTVKLHTPNPINASLENPATVARINADGTINVDVPLNTGQMQTVTGVKNAEQQTPEPWFEAVALEPAKA